MAASTASSCSRFLVSAPGKVILHGEHAVVYGKNALATSVDLRCYVFAELNDSREVSLCLPDLDITAKWSIDLAKSLHKLRAKDGQLSEEGTTLLDQSAGLLGKADAKHQTCTLAKKIFLYLCAVLYCQGLDERHQQGVQLTVISTLPFASGLGSSAAFSVCLAATFLTAAEQLSLDDGERTEFEVLPAVLRQFEENAKRPIRTENCLRLCKSDLEQICAWAYEGEKIVHGTPSGVDNTVATHGGAILFHRSSERNFVEHVDQPPHLRVLVVNTKVPRSTKSLVATVRSRREQMPMIINPILDAIDAIALECKDCWTKLKDADTSPDSKEFEKLKMLVDINQQLLCCIGVSHPAIDNVCRLASSCGLHSKLTGAGGGGCVVTLCPPGHDLTVAIDLLRRNNYDVFEGVLGGPGILVHHMLP